ncbi:MAG: hypothetical protein WHX53_01205 [Anaerolineae bacterium]
MQHRTHPLWTILLCTVLLLMGADAMADGASIPAADTWTIACVDCPRSFDAWTDRALRLLPDGRPAVAYGGDHLYYAWRDGESWRSEMVDAAPAVGAHASLALDANGRAHIAYYDAFNHDLKYAMQAADGWVRETVDAVGDAGGALALALDRTGRPHLLYYWSNNDGTSPILAYARRTDAGWETARVEALASTAPYISLALDADDRPHVAYYDEAAHRLRYARLTDGGWESRTVDDTGDVGAGCSLALDAVGHPHISYYDYDSTRGALRYAMWDGAAASWQIEVVDDAGDVGGYTSLALDGSGQPAISYHDYTNGALKFARRSVGGPSASAWQIETVEDASDVGLYTSLALDAENRPHILHFDLTANAIRYATWREGAWRSDQVDRGGRVGEYASLAFDAAGAGHISYYDVDAGHLKYAHQVGGAWTTETVDATPGTGLYTSLALDQAGGVHIAYQDGYEFDLKYALRGPTGWQIATVEAAGEVGAHAALAVDNAGRPHISYYDATARMVKYASGGATGWTIVAVEAVGQATSTALAVAADGTAHLAYCADETTGVLRYARRVGDGWQIETADASADAGGRIALVLGPQGAPFISYYDFAGHRVLLARRTESGWTTSVVAEGVGESHTALALRADGTPLVAFYDSNTGDLRFAQPTAAIGGGMPGVSEWSIVTVYSSGDVGAYPSLKLDAAGRPWISFYDRSNGDLLIARGPDNRKAIYLPMVVRKVN